MIKGILILIIGLIYGASLGIMWCTHQLKKHQEEETVMRVIVDIEELKKQMKEDNQ